MLRALTTLAFLWRRLVHRRVERREVHLLFLAPVRGGGGGVNLEGKAPLGDLKWGKTTREDFVRQKAHEFDILRNEFRIAFKGMWQISFFQQSRWTGTS